jgi:hypothetical protein
MSDSQQPHMSPKPTSGESARFHLSDYRLVAGHNFRVVVIRQVGIVRDIGLRYATSRE